MPCYAICMSGGYRDDVDEGLLVNYTGEGGQKGGKQVSINAVLTYVLQLTTVQAPSTHCKILVMYHCCTIHKLW